jgi:hypothetical protein
MMMSSKVYGVEEKLKYVVVKTNFSDKKVF